jgi:hypothetical protein
VLLRIVNCCVVILAVVANMAAQQTAGASAARADFQISGTLVDANTGQPISRARVALAPVTQRNDFNTVITGEGGRFLFPKLAPGKYSLSAQARGYLVQFFDQHDQYSSSIAVGPDLNSGNLVFRLPPEGAISGAVTDEAGEPVRDAQVMLYFTGLSAGAASTRLQGQAMTDDEGVYHFRHLRPGHYLVAVSARPWYAQYPMPRMRGGFVGVVPGNQGPVSFASSTGVLSGYRGNEPPNSTLDVAYPITFYSGVTDAASATPITLGRGDKVTADFSLQPVPALHLHLSTGSADPNQTTQVALERRVFDGPPIQVAAQTMSLNQGEQEIVGVPPGHYTMTTRVFGSSGSESSPSREIDVDSSGEIEKSQGSVYVPVIAKLQFAAGASPGQATLQLINKKSREISTERVDSDGAVDFKQGIVPGSYEVSLFSNSGIYVKAIAATGASVSGRTVEVRPGATVKLAISAAHGQGAVTGTALREGKPFAGAMIVLSPADPAHNQVLFRRDQSDSDGTFTLPNVVPGAYTLLAIENGWELEWMKPEVLRNYLGKGVAVQVQPNGKYDLKVNVQ